MAEMSAPIRVMIVEDHALVRTGLRTALRAVGFEVVGEAADGISAEEVARRVEPAVAVVDLGLPGRDGIELVRRLSALGGGPQCVVLTTRTDDDSIMHAILGEGSSLGEASVRQIRRCPERSRDPNGLPGPVESRRDLMRLSFGSTAYGAKPRTLRPTGTPCRPALSCHM
jgi:CheY-like chemotaxis protein